MLNGIHESRLGFPKWLLFIFSIIGKKSHHHEERRIMYISMVIMREAETMR
jgi:hypothetical protein